MAKGHVYRRRLNTGKWSSWYAVIDAPRRRDGKRRQITRSFPSRRMAEVWLAEQVHRSQKSAEDLLVLAEFLGEWIGTQGHLSDSTRVSYQGHIDLYLVPHLGSIPLVDLSTDMIEAVYRHLLDVGLSPATVRRINATLSSALSCAVRQGLIPANPARQVRSRRPDAFHSRVWSIQQAMSFLRFVAGDDLQVVWRLALIAGLRRGEILGLRSCDIDLEAGSLTVSQNRVLVSGRAVTKSPKTRHSRRSVALDDTTCRLLGELVALLVDPEALIFTDPMTGEGLDPGWVSRRFKQLVIASGLPVIRFHDLRHSSATLGLARGESVKEVSARLGHSSITVTGDLYLQVPTTVARRSAQSLADLLDQRATGDAA